MKVAINTEIGSFHLSVEALRRLDELNSPHLEEWDGEDFPLELYPDEYRKNGKVITYKSGSYKPEARTCPILLRVIEELGARAAEKEGSIKVVEIPDGIEWHIREQDSGEEWIAEKHRTWS